MFRQTFQTSQRLSVVPYDINVKTIIRQGKQHMTPGFNTLCSQTGMLRSLMTLIDLMMPCLRAPGRRTIVIYHN